MENEIIKFNSITEREDGVKLVSARELHEQLGSKRHFSDWIKPYIKEDNDYLFVEGVDFTSFHAGVNPTNNVPIKDYVITIDMAKELAMVSKSVRGKKCRRYFINLEKELKNAKEDNKKLYKIAVSDKEKSEREYEANKIKYALRNVKSLLLECDYTNLEATVNDILDFHTKVLKSKDRYEYYRDMDNTEYKQMIRKDIKDKLENIMITKQDLMLTMVAKTIQLQLESDSHSTTKRSTSHIISAKDKAKRDNLRQIRKLEMINDMNKVIINNYKEKYDTRANDINNYEVIELHGFSCNYMFKYDSQFGIVKTSAYKKWIRDFERYYWNNGLATKEDWEYYGDVDFTKPIVIYLKYVAKEEFDIENFNKSTIDMIFNRLFGVDDNIVHKVICEKIGICDDFEDGKIMYFIENL